MVSFFEVKEQIARDQALAESFESVPGSGETAISDPAQEVVGLERGAPSADALFGFKIRARREIDDANALADAQAAEEDVSLADRARDIPGGAIRGIASLPPAALKILELVSNSIPGGAGGSADVSQGPTPADVGLQAAHGLPGRLGIFDPNEVEADLPVSRRATRFGAEALGAGLVPAAGALKLSAGVTPAARAEPFLARTRNAFLGNVAKKPKGFIAGEVASAAGETAGRVIAQEEFPDSPSAELILGLSGATAPAVSNAVARKVVGTAKNIHARVAPGSTVGEETIQGNIAAELQSRVPGPGGEGAAANIDRSMQVQDVLGTEFSAGQAARSPGIARMERRAASVDPSLHEEFINQQSRTNQAIFDSVEELAPAGNPEAVRQLARKREIALADSLQSEVDAAVANVDSRSRSAAGGMTPEVSGEAAVEAVVEESRRAFAPYGPKYAELNARARASGATANSDFLTEAVRELKETTGRAKKTKGDLPDDVFNDILELTTETLESGDVIPKRISVFELRELNSSLKKSDRAIRDSLDRANDTKRPALQRLITAAEETLDDFIENALPEFQELANDFRDLDGAYRETSRRFRGPATGTVVAKSVSQKAESAHADAWFRPGAKGQKSMRQFNIAAAESPQAKSLMASHIVGKAIDEAMGADGLINARRLEKFKRKYRPALVESPRAAAEIDNVLRLQRRADETIGRQTRTMREYQNSSFQLFAKGEPHAAISRIVKAGSPAQQRAAAKKLMQEMEGDPEAVAGFRRMLWDDLTTQSVGDKLMPDSHVSTFVEPVKLRKTIRQYGPAIEEVFGREHLNNLEIIAEGAEIASMKGGARIEAVSDALNFTRRLLSGASFRAIYSRFYSGTVRGIRVGKSVMRVLANLTQMQQVDLMNEALLSPELAKTLLMESTGNAEKLVLRRLRGHLLTLGYRIPDEDEEDTQ